MADEEDIQFEGEIEFGDVQFESAESYRRPDRNRHWVVAPYGQPSSTDLPVFIDMDTLRDIEIHAQEDKTVELGGVLIGRQLEDESGQPYVMITDSLRAKHYESSRGHFKFTHDTWSQITQEHDDFSNDMKMVGWYHTHPGWGVFLSGMDTFICDHFFNRPLDVALVVDPINLDRGFFYWNTGDPANRLPQCKGFFIFTNRQRQRELAGYVYTLQGRSVTLMGRTEAIAGASDSLHSSWGNNSTMVPQQNNWMAGAVMGTMFLQVLLIALLALQMDLVSLTPGEKDKKKKEEEAAQKIVLVDERLKGEDERFDAQVDLLDKLLGNVRVDQEGLARAYADLREENERLKAASRGYRNLDKEYQLALGRLEDYKRSTKTLSNDKADLQRTVGDLKADLKNAESEKKKLAAQLAGEVGFWQRWQHYIFGVLGLLVGAASAGFAMTTLNQRSAPEPHRPSESSGTAEASGATEANPRAAEEEPPAEATSAEKPHESQ